MLGSLFRVGSRGPAGSRYVARSTRVPGRDRSRSPGSSSPRRSPSTGEDFRIVAPVELDGHGHEGRTEGAPRRAGVPTTLETDCSRCLEPFAVPVDATFDLLFLPEAGDGAAQRRRRRQEVREDDVGVSFYKDETIDLGEVMREQFYLALPMKPLCQADCQGLCPVCGDQPQPRDLHVPGRVGGPADGSL